jgi:hypothetical protein
VTNVVKDITGTEPEDFETIARREVGKRPEAKKTLMNTIKAICNFIKLLLTPTSDMIVYEKSVDIPRFMNGMEFADSNKNWLKTHK